MQKPLGFRQVVRWVWPRSARQIPQGSRFARKDLEYLELAAELRRLAGDGKLGFPSTRISPQNLFVCVAHYLPFKSHWNKILKEPPALSNGRPWGK